MIMTVDGQIRLKDVPTRLWKDITTRLTVQNPAYTTALRLGTPLFNVPRNIMLYEVRDNELIVPRGLWLDIWRQRPKGTVQHNNTVKLPPVAYDTSRIHLRDYQQQVADDILGGTIPQGVVVMPCGSGKTETGLYIVARMRQPALWITHTHDLVQQTVDRTKRRLGLQEGQVGVYGGGRREIGSHLTVATVQTLYNSELEDLAGCFGAVVVDECHRVVNNPENASMFCRVLAGLPAKYRFGLTASPERGDGLAETIFQVLGGELGHIDQATLQAAGQVITPRVLPVATGFTYRPAPGEQPVNFSRLLTHIARDNDRLELVLSHIVHEALNGGRCLVLASRLDMLEVIHSELTRQGLQSVYISGKSRPQERQRVIESMRAGNAQVLCATYQLAKEGLDIPRLDRVFLASPVRNSVAVQQTLGRVMRPAEGKQEAVVYDFVDKAVGVCKSQYDGRRRVYTQLGCEMEREVPARG